MSGNDELAPGLQHVRTQDQRVGRVKDGTVQIGQSQVRNGPEPLETERSQPALNSARAPSAAWVHVEAKPTMRRTRSEIGKLFKETILYCGEKKKKTGDLSRPERCAM